MEIPGQKLAARARDKPRRLAALNLVSSARRSEVPSLTGRGRRLDVDDWAEAVVVPKLGLDGFHDLPKHFGQGVGEETPTRGASHVLMTQVDIGSGVVGDRDLGVLNSHHAQSDGGGVGIALSLHLFALVCRCVTEIVTEEIWGRELEAGEEVGEIFRWASMGNCGKPIRAHRPRIGKPLPWPWIDLGRMWT